MSYDEFYDATPREFYNRLEGHRKAKEDEHKADWERARLVAYYAIAPHLKKGASNNMDKVIPLPWDHEKLKPVKISKEKEEELHALLDKIPFPKPNK